MAEASARGSEAAADANAEELSWRAIAMDESTELFLGFIGPWAKWVFLLFKALLENHPEGFMLFIRRIFGTSTSSDIPIRSPLNIVVSAFGSASEELLCDTAKMADVRATALYVCHLTILMLVMVTGDFGWKWKIGVHVVLFVYQLQFNANVIGGQLCFQAFNVVLCILNAFATPHTFASRLLLHLASSAIVFVLRCAHRSSMESLLGFPCLCLMLFYTPPWLSISGICLMFICFGPRDIYPGILAFVMCCTFVCFIHGFVYASAGGLSGALFLFLCSIVIACFCISDRGAALELVTPLPLVCVLLSCLYTSFQVGSLGTSAVICFLAAANDMNVKAILWWFVWLADLHCLSYALSQNFYVIAICFWGSYFTYGCIL